MLDEAEPSPQRLHPLRLVRRLPVPGPRQGRRRGHRGAPPAGPAERHAAGQRRGGQARDRPDRSHGDRRGRRARRPTRGVPGRRGGPVARARPTAPRSCCARPTTHHPNGLANGSDQVGSELHVPQLQGGGRPRQGGQRHRLPEDPRHQRLLPRRAMAGTGRSATSR